MIGKDDSKLYTEDHVAMHLLSLSKGAADNTHDTVAAAPEGEQAEVLSTAIAGDEDVSMADASASNDDNKGSIPGSQTESKDPAGAGSKADLDEEAKRAQTSAGNDQVMTNGDAVHDPRPSNAPTGEAVAASELVKTSSTPDQPFVHPMFLPPGGARPNRDLGVPENEAEDLRRMLHAFVQKQEEVARGSQRLHDGLNKAERLRKNVLHWSKAEAHCGPNRDLSDGEDWYDRAEWGLTEDLKKGQDDEEEDTTTTAKKTRARR